MHIRTCIAAVGLAAAPAFAQSIYLGGSLAYSKLGSDDFAEQVSSQDQSNFVSSRQRAEMSHGWGGRIFAGAHLNSWLAVELDYVSVRTISLFYASTSVHGAGLGFGESWTSAKIDALGLAAVGRAPAWGRVSVYARAGFVWARTRFDREVCFYANHSQGSVLTDCDAGQETPDVSQARPQAGLGMDLRLSQRVALRAGWDRYFGVGKSFERPPSQVAESYDSHGKFDVDLFYVGVSYRF